MKSWCPGAAEADLRVAIIEIDGRANTATLEAEKAKPQAALDRANGERVRLAHELANMKRQAKEALGGLVGSPLLMGLEVIGSGLLLWVLWAFLKRQSR